MSATVTIILVLVMMMGIMTLIAILHAGAREFDSVGRKAIWIMVAAIPFIGFIFYFLIGAKQTGKAEKPSGEGS